MFQTLARSCSAVVLLALVPMSAGAQGPWAPPRALDGEVGPDAPVGVALADLDGDGNTDALVVSTVDGKLAAHLDESGDGSRWREVVVTTALAGPSAVRAADVDGDGDVDAVTACRGDDALAWYPNLDGTGTAWGAAVPVATVRGAGDVFAVDVDGDGDVDLLSASEDDDEIAWHANLLGNGSSWSAAVVASGVDFARGVFAGDVDGDGDVDVLSASGLDDEIAWHANLFGNGSAWLTTSIATTADRAKDVFAADVDGDGDLDVLSASESDDEVSWYENLLGDGSSWRTWPISVRARGAVAVWAGDVDGDGDVDVASSAQQGSELAWYENVLGDGSVWSEVVVSTQASFTADVEGADLNRDGRLDLVSADVGLTRVTWYEQPASGAWTPHALALHLRGVSLAGGDVDGDGVTDLLVVDIGTVAWLRGGGDLSAPWDLRLISIEPDFANAVAAVDVDADGDLDALVTSSVDGLVRWFENLAGDGSTWGPHVLDDRATGVVAVIAADLDGDGDPDAVVTSATTAHAGWYENPGDGQGAWRRRLLPSTFVAPGALRAADLDGDGDLDLAVHAARPALSWYANPGTGGTGWTEHVVATTASAPNGTHDLALGDLDGDGDPDLVLGRSDPFLSDLSWYENRLDLGTPWVRHELSQGSFVFDPLVVTVGDLDADGDLDLIAKDPFTLELTRYENLGGATSFARRTLAGPDSSLSALVLLDADRDADLDLLSVRPPRVVEDLSALASFGILLNPPRSLGVLSGAPSLGTVLTLGVDNPLGTQAPGALPFLAISGRPDARFPAGTIFAQLGMNGPGELLLDTDPAVLLRPLLVGPPWVGPGSPAPIAVAVPPDPSFVGTSFFLQGALFDAAAGRVGLTNALRATIGP